MNILKRGNISWVYVVCKESTNLNQWNIRWSVYECANVSNQPHYLTGKNKEGGESTGDNYNWQQYGVRTILYITNVQFYVVNHRLID